MILNSACLYLEWLFHLPGSAVFYFMQKRKPLRTAMKIYSYFCYICHKNGLTFVLDKFIIHNIMVVL